MRHHPIDSSAGISFFRSSIRAARVRSAILFFAIFFVSFRTDLLACCPSSTTPTTLTVAGQLRFHSPKSSRFRSRSSTRRIERIAQALREMAAELADQINWPRDVDVTFEDCPGGSDAFYDDETHTVTICREMVDDFYQLFSLRKVNRTRVNQEVEGALVSVMLHEIAHAVIDVLDLPITGRQEDAADQLSTLLLINRTVGGAAMALDVAESFKLLARFDRGRELYWDEHSVHAQRYYDTLCLVYGSDERRFAYLVKNYLLPRERAAGCVQDYERIHKSWMKLLQPYAMQSLWGSKVISQ